MLRSTYIPISTIKLELFFEWKFQRYQEAWLCSLVDIYHHTTVSTSLFFLNLFGNGNPFEWPLLCSAFLINVEVKLFPFLLQAIFHRLCFVKDPFCTGPYSHSFFNLARCCNSFKCFNFRLATLLLQLMTKVWTTNDISLRSSLLWFRSSSNVGGLYFLDLSVNHLIPEQTEH